MADRQVAVRWDAADDPEAGRRTITIRIPAADFARDVDAALRGRASAAVIPGFRKGRVPMPVARRLWAGDAAEAAAAALVASATGKVLGDLSAWGDALPGPPCIGEPVLSDICLEWVVSIPLAARRAQGSFVDLRDPRQPSDGGPAR